MNRVQVFVCIFAFTVAGSAIAANDAVVLKCTVVEKPSRPEGITVKADGTWNSPPGGVLPYQSGKWIQNGTSGVVLQNASGKRFAEVLGLIFKSATAPASGMRFHVDATGDAGTCDVIAVTP